jgi:lipopolysaccharide exporter
MVTRREIAAQRRLEIELSPLQDGSRLGRKIALSSTYMIAGRLGMRAIGIVSTLVLVRILAPQDFGIVALAQMVYPILDLLTATGFNLAIIRMRNPDPAHYDTAWTLGVMRGAFIAICLVATSGLQARFMHEPRIAPVMWVVAASAFLDSLQNVRLFDFQRTMRFDLLTMWTLWGKLQGFIIVMLLAIFIRNYWILVVGTLISKMITVPGGYIIMPHRPRFSLAGWRDLFHFSKWLFLGNVCLLLDLQLMNLVVGRYIGMKQVGLFQVGGQIASLPISELAAPIRGPFYSGLSRVADDVRELGRRFLDGLAVQCALVLPLSAGLALTASDVVTLFLGAKWQAVTPILAVITLYQLFDAVGHYVHTIMMVTSRQRAYTLTYYASIAVRVPLTIFSAIHWGLYGACWAMAATALLNAVMWTAQANRILELTWWKELAVCWRSLAACAVMSVCVIILGRWIDPLGLGSIARLLLNTLVGGTVYVGFHWLLWAAAGRPGLSPEAYAISVLQSVLAQGRSLRLSRSF